MNQVLLVDLEGSQEEVKVIGVVQNGPCKGLMKGIDQNGDEVVIFEKDIICVLEGH